MVDFFYGQMSYQKLVEEFSYDEFDLIGKSWHQVEILYNTIHYN